MHVSLQSKKGRQQAKGLGRGPFTNTIRVKILHWRGLVCLYIQPKMSSTRRIQPDTKYKGRWGEGNWSPREKYVSPSKGVLAATTSYRRKEQFFLEPAEQEGQPYLHLHFRPLNLVLDIRPSELSKSKLMMLKLLSSWWFGTASTWSYDLYSVSIPLSVLCLES